MTVTCNTKFGSNNDSSQFPDITCFPPVNTYSFLNFERMQSHIFEKIIFPEKQLLTIKLINISIIEPEAFSNSISLPANSKLAIEIGDSEHPSSIILKPNAFNRIRIDRLQFLNLHNFNGRSIFHTNCFGNNLDIDLLIFDQCRLSGFENIIRKVADVDRLVIRNAPDLTQLTHTNLPSFLATTRSLEISNTGLETIQPHTFQAWSLILEELIIANNSNFHIFPPTIVDGVLMQLTTVDFSSNAIQSLHSDSNWFAYSYAKHLQLRNQRVDLFLRSNILTALSQLQTIDLSQGFISDNNTDLMKNYFPNMSSLVSIDVSYTNFTETMIVDLLTRISETANRFVDIYLRGHRLTDENFCSYFTVFKNAPKLLNLLLDDTHECNCVIELFYRDKLKEAGNNNSLLRPSCLMDASRKRCDIQAQLSVSNCNIGRPSPDQTNADDNIGKYAFGGVTAGIIVALVVLLSLGFGVVYRIRRRRNTELTMEQPIENPLAAIIEERLHNA